MKSFLKWSLASFAALLLTVILFVAWIWFFPGFFIHEGAVKRYGLPQLEKRGVHVSADELKLSSESESFWVKAVNLRTKNLCVEIQGEGENCFSEANVQGSINLKGFALNAIRIGELRIVSNKLRVRIPADEKSPTEPSTFNAWAFLKKFSIGDLYVDVPEFVIRSADDRYSGNVKLENSAAQGLRLNAKIESEKKTSFELIQAQVSSDQVTKVEDLLKLKTAQAEARLAGKKVIKLTASRENAGTGSTFSLQTSYNGAPVRADIGAVIQQQGVNLQGVLSGSLHFAQLRGPLQLRDCGFTARLPEKQKEKSLALIEQGRLSCKFEVQTRDLVHDQKYLSSIPKKLDLLLTAEIKQQKTSQGGEELVGGVKLEVGPVVSPLIEGRMVASYDINFSRDDEASRIDFDPILIDTDLVVKDFLTLAKILNSTSLVIPSPVNVLKGTVTIKGKGEVSPKPLNGSLAVDVRTNLAADGQALDMQATGKVTFQACEPPRENTFISVDLRTTQTKLRLPNIDYKKPPVIMPDSRFVLSREAPKKASGCPLAYKFDFQNEKQPIFIQSEFLKKDLPLNMEIHAQNEKPVDGKIIISNYSTQLFKRNATVENFLLNLKNKELRSRIRVDYADYKIFILLSGTTQSVQMNLESDPPMSREQAFSVLLFGKPLEGLEPDETGSVRNADAAAKDGALTLASLYIFASTPIESVGYNPHTNGLVTKVKLANGTTLNVGANSQGLTDAGLTRRLSKHWRIQTTVQEPQEENRNRSASTLLEWFHRF